MDGKMSQQLIPLFVEVAVIYLNVLEENTIKKNPAWPVAQKLIWLHHAMWSKAAMKSYHLSNQEHQMAFIPAGEKVALGLVPEKQNVIGHLCWLLIG